MFDWGDLKHLLAVARHGSTLAALLACTAAFAAPEVPMPFVQANGLAAGVVRYSDVVKALGEPAQTRITPGSGYGQNASGDDFLFSYPQQGLSFRIDRKDRPKGDPPIESMTVAAPAQAETPQGLRVGMPSAEALRILQAHYREEHRYHFGENSALSTVVVSDLHGKGQRQLSVGFEQGAVRSLRFDLQDPPWLSTSTRRALVDGAVLVLVLAAGVGWMKLRARLGLKPIADEPDDEEEDDSPRPGLLVIGVLMFIGAAAAGAMGLPLARGGGYEAYLGLIMLAAVAGLVLFGGALLMRSGYRAATWLGGLIVGGLLLASVLPKLMH